MSRAGYEEYNGKIEYDSKEYDLSDKGQEEEFRRSSIVSTVEGNISFIRMIEEKMGKEGQLIGFLVDSLEIDDLDSFMEGLKDGKFAVNNMKNFSARVYNFAFKMSGKYNDLIGVGKDPIEISVLDLVPNIEEGASISL